MIKELDVVKIVNCPVNFPQYWNQEGTVVHWQESHPGYHLIEFADGELEFLHESFLKVTWVCPT